MLGWIDLTVEETTRTFFHAKTPPKKQKYFELAKVYILDLVETINKKLIYLNNTQDVLLFQIAEVDYTNVINNLFYYDFVIKAYEGNTVQEEDVIGISHNFRIAVDCGTGKAVCGVIDRSNAAKKPYINSSGKTHIAPGFTISRTSSTTVAKPFMLGTIYQTAIMDVSILATKNAFFLFTGSTNSNKIDSLSFIRCIDTNSFRQTIQDVTSYYTWLSNGWFDSTVEIVKGDKPLKVKLHTITSTASTLAVLYEMLLEDRKTKAPSAYIPHLYETDQWRTVHGNTVNFNYINLSSIRKQTDEIYFFVPHSIQGLRGRVMAIYPKQEE